MSKSPMLSASFNDPINPEHELASLIERCGGYVLGSFKLDGIRAIWWEGKLVSRSLKPIPNRATRVQFEKEEFRGFDGELILGTPHGKSVFEGSHSAAMTQDGIPGLNWWIFDNHLWNEPFHKRVDKLNGIAWQQIPNVFMLKQQVLKTPEEILEFETMALDVGFEGVILRSPGQLYKYGRSTLKQAGMIKMKRMLISKARIVGVVEMMRNANEPTQSLTGHQVRSSHKAGQVPAGMMGAIECVDIYNGKEFEIGSGFDVDTRIHVWNNKQYYIDNMLSEYKYLPYGTREKPRHPIHLRFIDKTVTSAVPKQ